MGESNRRKKTAIEEIKELFDLEAKLGEGGMGVVVRAQARQDSPKYPGFLANMIALREATDKNHFSELREPYASELTRSEEEIQKTREDIDSLSSVEIDLHDKNSKDSEKDKVNKQRLERKNHLVELLRELRINQGKYLAERRPELMNMSSDDLGLILTKHGIVLPHDNRYALKVAPKDPELERDQDKKRQLEEVRRRLMEEWLSLINLKHPNVVNVYSGVGSLYYVMELIRGKKDTKKDIIGNYKIRDITNICIEALKGLEHCHKNGLVHRDIKPDNIAVDENGDVRLIDFGLAKTDHAGLTATAAVAGTLYYMPPEGLKGIKSNIDEISDLYSIFASFYHLIVGEPPFYMPPEIASNLIIAQKIAEEQPRPPEGIILPAGVQDIIDIGMDKNSMYRPQTAAEARTILERYLVTEDPEILNLRTLRGNADIIKARQKEIRFRRRRPSDAYEVRHSNGRRRTPAPQKKSNTGLYALVAGAVGVVGLAAALMFGGNGSNNNNNNNNIKLPPSVSMRPPKVEAPVVPVVETPNYSEQYVEFLPTVQSLEKDIESFLKEGNDLRKLEGLDNRLKDAISKANYFKENDVGAAKGTSDKLFDYTARLAARKSLFEEYNEFGRSVQELEDRIKSYALASDLNKAKQDVKRMDEEILEAKLRLDSYRDKKMKVDEIAQRLMVNKGRIAKFNEDIRKKEQEASKPVVVEPAVDPLEEAYSNFDSQIRRGLSNDIVDFIELGNYDNRKLNELLGKVKEARTELVKYDGREGADTLADILNDRESELLERQKFISVNSKLLSDISRYEGYIKGFLENPVESQKSTNIARANYFISKLAPLGEQAEPMIGKLKSLISRIEGNETEEPKVTANVAVPKDAVLAMESFDKEKIVYNKQDSKWYVIDSSQFKNHGVIVGNFAGNAKTGKPIVFSTYEEGVQAGYQVFLIQMQDKSYGIGLHGGKIEIADNDNLDLTKELDIGIELMIKELPNDRTSIINKYTSSDRGYTLELGVNNEPINNILVCERSEAANRYVGKRTNSKSKLNVEEWYKLRCSFRKNNQTIIINGVVDIEDKDEMIGDQIANNNNPLIIGYSPDEKSYFYGIIKNLFIRGK